MCFCCSLAYWIQFRLPGIILNAYLVMTTTRIDISDGCAVRKSSLEKHHNEIQDRDYDRCSARDSRDAYSDIIHG
jgi:hypothetical protein